MDKLILLFILLVCSCTGYSQPCAGTFAYDCDQLTIGTQWSANDSATYPVITIDVKQQSDSNLHFYFDLSPNLEGFVNPPGCAVASGLWYAPPFTGWRFFQINTEKMDPSCKMFTYDIYNRTNGQTTAEHCMTYIFLIRKRWEVKKWKKQ